MEEAQVLDQAARINTLTVMNQLINAASINHLVVMIKSVWMFAAILVQKRIKHQHAETLHNALTSTLIAQEQLPQQHLTECVVLTDNRQRIAVKHAMILNRQAPAQPPLPVVVPAHVLMIMVTAMSIIKIGEKNMDVRMLILMVVLQIKYAAKLAILVQIQLLPLGHAQILLRLSAVTTMHKITIVHQHQLQRVLLKMYAAHHAKHIQIFEA